MGTPAPHTAIPNSAVVGYDTIASINAPTQVAATLTSGAVVEVPASAVPGGIVLFDNAGNAPATAIAGTDYFTADDFAAKFKELS